MGQHGLVVYFVRDFGCHTCLNLARALVAKAVEVADFGYGLVVVGGGTAAQASRAQAKWATDVPVLADPRRGAYEAFGLSKVCGYWQKSGAFVVTRDGGVVFGEGAARPAAGMDMVSLFAALARNTEAREETRCLN